MIRIIPPFLFFLIFLFQNSSAQDSLSAPDPDKPTKVYISVVLNNISDINGATEIMRADIFLVAKWKDPRLAHGGNERVVKSVDDVWDPWLTIINRFTMSKTFPDVVNILNDGTVIYMQRVFGDFSQNFHLKEFPFDIQTLDIKIIAVGLSAKEVELLPGNESESGISGNLSLPDWKIANWNYDETPYSYLKNSPEVPALTFSFTAKRESGFYILIYVIPLILIIMMSWMVFWVDPNLSSSQISVATTSMLTLIAYRFVVSQNLPKISYLTRLDVFVLGSSILIFFTLIEAVISSSLSSRGNGILGSRIALHCRWLFPLLYFIVTIIAFVL